MESGGSPLLLGCCGRGTYLEITGVCDVGCCCCTIMLDRTLGLVTWLLGAVGISPFLVPSWPDHLDPLLHRWEQRAAIASVHSERTSVWCFELSHHLTPETCSPTPAMWKLGIL